LRSYLEKDSFRVVIAYDGEEALYVAHHEEHDLVAGRANAQDSVIAC